ncbi:Mandelate racemase/muconate lactonizing protein [Paenibacillus curdlanolyticus YK9]|uniref:Mandelate racemase/muconate lactonizing protein n=1 Tax=Paenibacillus curdlanolyticus YK9 TaxID=717606 RepID=E0I867_9BACL|nr:enolase C-terminal domain-like protein [Paenibacillus curdlanolyticus]EFM11372.1 Mandelate racemase/muconate lactonizing protein [Paenibacillus curdlanolyticus YK9]
MAKITGIRCIRTRTNGTWTIVKVTTDQDGLYGIGSASDMYNPEAVIAIIEQMLAPQLIGRDAANIEDLWHTMNLSSYWRNGAMLQTAIGGIDMALWDIKGKMAGMPVYQLLGGASRAAVPCYGHAGGSDIAELKEDISHYLEEGYTVIRAQLGGYGGGGFIPNERANLPENAWTKGPVFDEQSYLNAIPRMFEELRVAFGSDVAFTHDVHEHLSPITAIQLAKRLEPYNLFFLEDVLAPEQIGWYRQLRQQSATPQAVGELFVNSQEWLSLVQERLIDFIRVRVSKAGGITACRKIASLCEAFGVRTAWQEGGENDPVNQAAAVHLDMSVWNFGIQEVNHFRPAELEAFPGHVVRKGGYLYPSDKPGLGIELDEEKAELLVGDGWNRKTYHSPYSLDRKADGTLVRP